MNSEISYKALGNFAINVKSKSGVWFSYTHASLPGKNLVVEFIKEGKSPYPPVSKTDRDALAWLHSCKTGVSNYFTSTYDFSSIWKLKTCSNSNIDLSILASVLGMSSKNFDLESRISKNGSEGYSISVKPKSGKWFSLIWAYDDLLPQIPPLLIEGRPNP